MRESGTAARDTAGASARPDRAELQRVAERVADQQRPVDLLVNNAGFGQRKDFLVNDVEEEQRAVDLMVGAVMVTWPIFLPLRASPFP